MLKALALETFGFFGLPKTKKHVVKFTKSTTRPWKYYFALALIASNAILLMSYVYGVNQYTSAGYEIKSLEKKVGALNEDNKKVSLKVSEASSMVSIQNDFLSSSYVEAGTSKYLQVKTNEVSLK